MTISSRSAVPAALAALVSISTVVPALASDPAAPHGGIAALEARAPASGGRVRDLARSVERARAAFVEGSLAQALDEAMSRASVHGLPLRPGAAPVIRPHHLASPAMAGLPPAARRHLSDLVGAADLARRLVREAIPISADLRARGRALRRAAGRRYVDKRVRTRASLADERFLPAKVRPSALGIDGRTLATAAALMAAALDRDLPALTGLVPTGGPGRASAGCDLVDLPSLCLAGLGPNIHDESHRALTIDLGGDDTWTNDAGSGNLYACDTENPAATPDCLFGVAIDLGGNDLYRATFRGIVPKTLDAVAQGAAWGGIGWLVDAAGDDRYEVVMAPDETGRITHFVGQGAGTLFGIGLLADLGGQDAYTLTQTLPSEEVVHGAQGSGIEGLGLLLDRGVGDEEYRIVAATSAVGEGAGAPFVSGQADGVFAGVGVLADGGGNDVLELVADAQVRTVPPPQANIYWSSVGEGQGVGAAGEGLLLTGVGNTTYHLRARTVLVFQGSGKVLGSGGILGSSLYGQAGGGGGFVDDLAGNDRYAAESEVDARVLATPGEDGAPAIARLLMDFGPNPHAFAQAVGGLLHDHEGNDRYEARALIDQRATATSPDERGAEAVVDSSTYADVWAQASSSGYLIDDTGDDRYLLDATSVESATARSEGGDEDAFARQSAGGIYNPSARLLGQGSFDGVLVDAAGHDLFEALGTATATAFPDPARGIDGTVGNFAQGTESGEIVSLGLPTFRSTGISPRLRAAGTGGRVVMENGHEGEGPAWGAFNSCTPFCTPFVSWGVAPNAPAKAATSIVLEDPEHRADTRWVLRARLLAAAGAPLAGMPLTFMLANNEFGGIYPYGVNPIGLEGAITDVDGRAEVVVDGALLHSLDDGQRVARTPELTAVYFFGDGALRASATSRAVPSA